jgi:hypothetical protein
MSDRCDITDLLVDQCAHCRKLPDPVPPARAGPPITAAWPGRCANCKRPFDAGDRIRRLGDDGSYIGPCCHLGTCVLGLEDAPTAAGWLT